MFAAELGRMKLNTNRDKQAYWDVLQSQVPETVLNEAINSLQADTARVIRLHYGEGRKLTEISTLVGKSISVVRNHQNRGICRLYRYFNPRTTG